MDREKALDQYAPDMGADNGKEREPRRRRALVTLIGVAALFCSLFVAVATTSTAYAKSKGATGATASSVKAKKRPGLVYVKASKAPKAKKSKKSGVKPLLDPSIPSSQGTDFWVGFQSNCTFDGCGTPSGPGDLYLFISGATATTGTVTDSAISFSQSFSVTPGAVTTIQVPSDAENDLSDSVVSAGAVHISSGVPVSAYGLNTLEYTTDGYLGLPTSILGNSYLVEGYGAGTGSQFMVVGTQNGTTVTITPSEDVDGYTEGVPYTETLNQGDEYQLVDTGGGDISGTLITSSAPVAVFAGNDCADVPVEDYACNTLTEEMTPTDTWGTDFLTDPLATRSGDTFRVMASENGTNVDIDGSQVASLDQGQFYETILTSASSITANNPIQVMQYSNGSSYDGANADPFDITIPPTEQFLNSYTVTTEPDGADPAITQNYLNIVAPTSETSSIELDGTDLPSSDFAPISGSTYSSAEISVDFGDHNVSAALPFGLTIYGYGGYDGYGYPGGFTLSPIATVSKVTLSPTTSTYTVGTSACETATVTDQNGDPVDGVRVDFTVTGVNPNAGFAYSGTDGTAQYCYTGTNTGADSESAAVGSITSNTAAINWTPAGKTPTSVSTALSGGGQTGATISVPSGTAVTDQATLSGTNAASASGTVTYSVFSDAACTVSAGSGGTVNVTGGSVPASSAVTETAAGPYYWEATYSGDSTNQGSTSPCGSAAGAEVETVTPPTTGPTCQLTSVINGPPKEILVTVQAPDGLSSVVVTEDVNDTYSVPTFTPGTTSPVVVSATKTNQGEVSEFALTVTDQAGNSVSCDPADFTLQGGSREAQSVSGLPAAEHTLTITNDSLRSITVTVNGVRKVIRLTSPGEVVSVDLGALFNKASNKVTLRGVGPGNADVLFQD